MDSNSDVRSTGRVSSEPTLTAYLQEATGDSDVSAAAPQADTWTLGPRLDSQSRNNLRQASVALDTAYERITSLRNSINDMLNRLPPEVAATVSFTNGTDTGNNAQPRHSLSHDASIRPSHSALVLSSEQAVEELNLRAARLRSLISPSARQRLEEFESNSRSNARRESAWDRFTQSDRLGQDAIDLHPVSTRPRTPPMPDLVLPRSRDLVDPRTAQRRDIQSSSRDDSTTMIGRRVAARVNAPESYGSNGNLSSRLSLSQIEQRLQAQTAQIARELESMTDRLAAQRSRVELAGASVRGDSATSTAQNERVFTPSQVGSAATSGQLRLVPHPPAGARPIRPARDVTLVDNTTRIVLPQPISRTSSDGTPIDDFAISGSRGLSAVFRENFTIYRDRAQGADTSQDIPRNLASTPEIRGTFNLLAQDRVDQLLSVPQADPTRPGADRSRRDEVPAHSSATSPSAQGRRRRGWTRLNADGDEIDSEEDDNVSPHTRRLRMRFAYGTSNVDQPTTRSHTVTIEDILWRTSGSDSEADALSPDLTESCLSLFQGSPPRPPVPCPHPLPTPVEDMLIYPTTKAPRQPHMISVSKYANLAGR